MKTSDLANFFSRRFHIPGAGALHRALAGLSFLEKTLVAVLFALLIGSTVSLLLQTNGLLSVNRPAPGGALVEGVIGAPRFVNPVLAASEADADLTALVYAGLMNATPEGELIPALAEKYAISDDGLVYTFTVRQDAVFHDGQSVTADDVLFTISMIQNPSAASPRAKQWEGVAARKIDERTVEFTLPRAYAPFLENATIGILPAHVWADVPAETLASHPANLAPVGAGPFIAMRVERDDDAVPTAFVLRRFDKYVLGTPFLSQIIVRFYPNEHALIEAYREGDIDAVHSIAAESVAQTMRGDSIVKEASLPRIFGVFFNQSHAPVLAEKAVREALDVATPREEIIAEVLKGYGTTLTTPLPPHLSKQTPTLDESSEDRIARAREMLEDAGWKLGEDGVYANKSAALKFSIATANTAELKAAASLVADAWKELGADVSVELFDLGALRQNIIRPREYDALLFGEVVGRGGDLYPFWHSSQRNDPGLNIALYTNRTADDILKDIRETRDPGERQKLHEAFEEEIAADTPAVFLYSPRFLYIVPAGLRGIELGVVETPSERFLDAHKWYFNTRKVWDLFGK